MKSDSLNIFRMDDLICNVEKHSMNSFLSRKDENEKLVRNIANFGLPVYGIAQLEREGEYNGFGIQAIEEIKPLLTETRILKALKFLRDDDLDLSKAINELHLENETVKYGTNIIYYVLEKWLRKNKINIPEKIEKLI